MNVLKTVEFASTASASTAQERTNVSAVLVTNCLQMALSALVTLTLVTVDLI